MALSPVKKIVARDPRGVGHSVVEVVETIDIDDVENVSVIEAVRSEFINVFHSAVESATVSFTAYSNIARSAGGSAKPT